MHRIVRLTASRSIQSAGQTAVILISSNFGPHIPPSRGGQLFQRGYKMSLGEAVPITINGQLYRKITEGKADIVAPYQAKTEKPKKQPTQANQPRNNAEGEQAVFYNPVQQYNRDLSVLAILTYGEGVIEEKTARHTQNLDKSAKRQARKKQRQPATEIDGTSENGTVQGSTKRKLDDTEHDSQSEFAAKRPKSSENGTEADLEVQQLAAPEKFDNAKAPENGEARNEEPAHDTPQQQRQVPFTILDALSASGLRAVRYAKEIPFATKIVANDMLPQAVEAIKLNIEHNKIGEKVIPNTGDAIKYMYNRGDNVPGQPSYVPKFDVVDLDPYGTAAPFLDAAIQSLTDGGLLCVTCTDAGVWASNGYPEKAFALYNGTTLKGPHSHEGGLRLILNAVATTAAKYGIAIEPLLSLSIDFYARLFIRIHKSQQEVKLLAGTTMFVYACDQGCGAWSTQLIARNQKCQAKNGETYFKHSYAQAPQGERYCEHCGTKTHLGGPMWAGPLHHPVFVKNILEKLPSLDKTVYGTTDRIKGMLTVALEEEDLDWNPQSVDKQTNGANQATTDTTPETASPKPTKSAVIPRMPPNLLSPSPFFFLPTFLSKVLAIMTPGEDPFRGAFIGLGYSCTRSHCKPGSFKTNAPWSVIWEVLREWARQRDAAKIPRLLGEGEFEEKRSVKKSTPGYQILKRLRGRSGNTLAVTRMKEELLTKLGRGPHAVDVETMEDLQNVLKSVMYEIEHPTTHGGSAQQGSKEDANGNANGEQPAKVTGKALIDAGGDPSELEIVFDEKLGKAFKERGVGAQKLVRYQVNPRAHWGPMVRAGAS